MNFQIPLIISVVIAAVFFLKKSNENGDRLKKTMGIFVLSIFFSFFGMYIYENGKNDNMETVMKNMDFSDPDF